MLSTQIHHPMVTHEKWENFTETDHTTWKTLFDRQEKLLDTYAVDPVMAGLRKLQICQDKIPRFDTVNAILKKETGFSIVPVTGSIPVSLLFKLLSVRRFPSTCFIRQPEQMDYLEAPDIFHDVFGHMPLLSDPLFADAMALFGKKGVIAMEMGLLKFAAALYWFTVEFGLINTKNGLRVYGAGILSSKSEMQYSIDDMTPLRLQFNGLRMMKTQYHVDALQKTYFVITHFQQLFDFLSELDWGAVQHVLPLLPDIDQGVALNNNEKITGV